MSRCVVYQSGGFTNYGISYRKYSQEELEEMKKKMLSVEAQDGSVEIRKMEGIQRKGQFLIQGKFAHKTMLLIANDGAKSAEEVYLKYGMLVRELVDYMEITVQRVNEMRK